MIAHYVISSIKDVEIWPLDEVKNYLRISHDYDDQLIVNLIGAATDSAELFIGINLREKQINCMVNVATKTIRLKHLPISEINQISLIEKGEKINITSEFVDIKSSSHLLQTPDKYIGCSLEIEYQSGYLEVPRSIKHGMLMHIAAMYENAEDAVILSPQIKDLYAPYRSIKI